MSISRERMAKMAERVAQEEVGRDDEPLAMVDQAIDTMIACVNIINGNLPSVAVESVPQKAAVDRVRQLLDEAIAPYLAEIVNHMEAFE